MILNVVSWNTQGAAVATITQACNSIFLDKVSDPTEYVRNVVLLQETGTDNLLINGELSRAKFGKTDYCGLFVPQQGAINKRCTTGIFADNRLIDPKATQFGTIPVVRNEIVTEEAIKVIDKKEPDARRTCKTPRPAVTFELKDSSGKPLILATMHATSYHPIAKKEVVQVCNKLQLIGKDWFLMGDFNCDPGELLAENIPIKNMSFTKEPTQQSGGTLDFAVFSDAFIGRIKVGCGSPKRRDDSPLGSDHYPVYFQLQV